MNAGAKPYFTPERRHARPQRKPAADPATVRRAWLDLADDARRCGEHLVKSDGEELLEPPHLRHGLTRLDQHSFPTPGASAQAAAYAFLLLLRGVLDASDPRRRAVLAPALVATAKAIDQLMNDQAVAAAAAWKRRLPSDFD